VKTPVRIAALFVLLITLGTISHQAHGRGGNHNPGVIPPKAKYKGHSYGEWEAKWWQAAFALPVIDGDHPIISGGSFGGDDGVLFLTGIGGPATIDLTIPAGTPLFFPVVNFECSVFEPPPFHGDDEESLRAQANQLADNTSDLFAVIDGKTINDIQAYRVQSPLFQWGPLPDNNILQFFGLDAPAGTTSPAVDAGYYLLLAPLSVGEHTIHFGAMIGGELSGSIDTTYVITVVPKR
jgi:hypothetical protein